MILAIIGPTGVGKTKLSVALAHKYNAIIINCDSMQVYRDLNIGTAKITEEEKEGIPHYLFDIKNVTDDYTVYDYQKDVRKLIEENKNQNIILVGGTGLYLKAALYDYQFTTETSQKDYSEYTTDELYKMALQKDPETSIHPHNRQRLERFLNKEKTEYHEPIPLYKHLIIGLTTDRDKLYNRINNRVDQMIKNGLLDEVKSFYDQGIKSKPLLGGIGYKELYAYFNGELSLDTAIENIKKDSRHYAKRQYTFFNNQFDVKWFDVDFTNFQNTINNVIEYVEKENNND
mgnify:FL=1